MIFRIPDLANSYLDNIAEYLLEKRRNSHAKQRLQNEWLDSKFYKCKVVESVVAQWLGTCLWC